MAIGVANAMHIHVHPVWDVISALLVKSQPLFDNFFIMRTLRQLVSHTYSHAVNQRRSPMSRQ